MHAVLNLIYYTGVLIGTLPTEQHQVSGQFHIVDSKTLFIENFNYDGQGPGSYSNVKLNFVCKNMHVATY